MRLSSLLFLMFLLSLNTSAQYTNIDNNISIKFEGKHTPAKELLKISTNKSIVWLERVYIGKEEELFGLTKYVNKQKAAINDVFEKYVRNVTPPLTTVLEAGSYKKNGVKYYYKISETLFSDKVKRANVMYYVMPYNYSDVLYEFKITNQNFNKIAVMNYLEKLVNSVKYTQDVRTP